MSWQNNLHSVSPYIAGEQPELTDMIKLNTNENPYQPSLQVQKVIEDFKSENLRLYPSTDAKFLRKALAEYHHLNTDQVFIGNGSDEVLSLSFLTFFNGQRAILMPDISYSFYPIYCELYRIPYQKIPLADDFSLSVNSYFQENGGIVIANPNAPTGMAISLQEIEEILQNNQDSIVLIDEASLNDETYFQKSVSKIITTRENFKNELIKLGFQVTDSKTNFVFVHHPKIDATTLFKVLYEAKIIVRHWNQARISDWLRITIGTDREMNTVIQFLKEYLKNKEKSY
ncbi:pyridoxal phosphate-dependent aminotransferase [Lactococcus cremoris]|uniref:pyridoxal phosphate-dependent aminotransferase n=1 Tax=Lactococcus lactis subsp. cremoris TaxID=1359 RepID=UPI002204C713|nr:histidinol-phosphate transaminase [Lactococcus cremoris]UXV61986.1 histidinol-phosphate transaminase [Lactococcus cremoris]